MNGGPASPHVAAAQWLQAVREGDAAAMWCHMTPVWRRRLARKWLAEEAPAAAADIVEEFAAPTASSGLWQTFVNLQRELFLRDFLQRGLPLNVGQGWAWAVEPRAIAPNIEAVLLVETSSLALDEHGYALDEVAVVGTLAFYAERSDDAWLLASIHEPPPMD